MGGTQCSSPSSSDDFSLMPVKEPDTYTYKWVSDQKSSDAQDGQVVTLPKRFNPYDMLGLSSQSKFQNWKSAFRRNTMMASSAGNRQALAKASLAYFALTSNHPDIKKGNNNEFTISSLSIEIRAAAGDTNGLIPLLKKEWKNNIYDRKILNSGGHSLLYLGARGGFFDVCYYLLRCGDYLNSLVNVGSTALHAAAWYRHNNVLRLLLAHGADTTIKNKFGHTAEDEVNKAGAALIASAGRDVSTRLLRNLRKIWSDGVIPNKIESKKSVVAYRFRKRGLKDNCYKTGKLVWHGTLYQNLCIIADEGLKIATKERHEQEDRGRIGVEETFRGIKNWGSAIFTTPSLTYACHSSYSEKVKFEGENWCCVIEAFVKGKYMTTASTVKEWTHKMKDDPSEPEYRSEDETDVTVCGILLVKHGWVVGLKNSGLSFLEMRKLFGK